MPTHRLRAALVLFKDLSQRRFIAALIGKVGLCHQSVAQQTIRFIGCIVGMDLPDNLSIKRPQFPGREDSAAFAASPCAAE